jgi:predicted aldo/keto reductase-like oxidoreductase
MSAREGGSILRHALELGYNWIDGAAYYNTYPHIREALRGYPHPVLVSTKTHAKDAEEAAEHVEEARQALDRDVIDIFLVHGGSEADALSGRRQVIDCLLDHKARGVIRAVGVATHHISVVREAAISDEMEVIFALINKAGYGIVDGTAQEMSDAVDDAHRRGKGVYAMKALGGGTLLAERREALRWVLGLPGLDSIAVGINRPEEAEYNLRLAEGRPIEPELETATSQETKRFLAVPNLCKGCGECAEVCNNDAITMLEGKAWIEPDACLLCGYCVPACEELAIRMI